MQSWERWARWPFLLISLTACAPERETPPAVLSTSAFAAVLDAIIGPEIAVEDPITVSRAGELPAVAVGPEGLTSWMFPRRS